MSNVQLTKTVLKEIQDIYKTPKFFDNGFATIEFDRNDITNLKIVLCPQTGYFRKTICKFSMNIHKNYPARKPEVKSLNKLFHPNISTSSGSVCFSMFGSHWKNDFRISDYISGLLFHLNHPNHDSPLESRCVMKDEDEFDKLVRRAIKGENIGGRKYDRVTTSGVDIKDSLDLYCKIKNIEERNEQFEKNER